MNDSNAFLFDGVSSKLWKQKIQFELNGASYNTLIHQDNEQIPVRPFYHFDENIPRYEEQKSTTPHIVVPIYVANILATIERIEQDIKQGVSLFQLIFKDEKDCFDFFAKVNTKDTTFFIVGELTFEIDAAKLKSSFPNLDIVVLVDPIYYLSKNGNWQYNMEKDLSLIAFNSLKSSSNSTIGINTTILQNAGATMIQQLGFGMAWLAEYYNRAPKLSSTVHFSIAIGSNYFFEIAKIKALRILFKIITDDFSIRSDCHITAVPSTRNKSWLESDNNTIRKSTEYLSAILGGVDALQTQTADFMFKKESLFNTRLAKNQLLILLEEFNLNTENNPTEGCYYIDYLTHQLAQKGLELFKEIERKGGYLHLLKTGDIQKRINENAQREQELFDNETTKSIGVNLYQNVKSIEKIQKPELYPFTKVKHRKTIIKPIVEIRLAEKIEKQLYDQLD